MQLHVLLTKFTEQHSSTSKNRLKRLKAICSRIENAGGNILNIYNQMGLYDIVIVFEAVGNNSLNMIENDLFSSDFLTDTRLMGPYPQVRHHDSSLFQFSSI